MTVFLADFSVMDPSFGLLFWTTVVFILVWVFIGKFAFKPILGALKERESSIDKALHEAEEARKAMSELKSSHEEELQKARQERAKIVKEAETLRDKIVEDAKNKAEETTRVLLENAKAEISNRQKEMEQSLYNQIGQISLNIAQQLMVRELQGKHEEFIAQKVEEFKKQNQAKLN